MLESNLQPAIESVENKTLQELITKGELINLYLRNGIKLHGHVIGFDKYAMLFKSHGATTNNNCQLIYKHAIATVLLVSNNNQV